MRALALLLLLGGLYFFQELDLGATPQGPGPTLDAPVPRGEDPDGAILAAYRERRSDVIVTGEGAVEKVLRDDNEGSRHQKFLLRLDSGHTLLISHNIDLAPRIPGLRRGDRVQFKGEYEWNERGGVVHWTHRDPAGRHPHGWLLHGARRFE